MNVSTNFALTSIKSSSQRIKSRGKVEESIYMYIYLYACVIVHEGASCTLIIAAIMAPTTVYTREKLGRPQIFL